jgi:hypothetical protein
MTTLTRLTPDEFERRRLAIQTRFDASRSLQQRNRAGQFATPTALADEVTQHVLDLAGGEERCFRFGEPSLGTGAFYSSLLRLAGEEWVASAEGIELDPDLAAMASRLWGTAGLRVICGDFTDPSVVARAERRPNLLLANPPYVRHHHLTLEQKDRLRSRAVKVTGIPVSGLAGLYVYFVLLSHDWLEEGGIAAWLIPSEWMEVNYGDALRRYLTERVTLLSVHRYDPAEVQFGDALVSSTVVVYRKCLPQLRAEAAFTYGGSITDPARGQKVEVARLRGLRKWSALPHAESDEGRVASCELPVSDGRPALTIGDLFRVRRGIATGANEFFILTREEARRHGLPDAYLRPILPGPRHLRETVIERGADGHPCLDGALSQVVIDCDLPEAEVREAYPALWRYFESGRTAGLPKRYLLSQRKPWYKQERRPAAPLLCTYMGRGGPNAAPFRFLLNRSDAVAPNVYLQLHPAGTLAEMLNRYPERDVEVFELLNEITSQALKAEGRVYGGGLHKIEPKELERIPATAFLARFPELAPLRLFERKAPYQPTAAD